MNISDLRPDQLRKLHDLLNVKRKYLSKVVDRMHACKFSERDRFYRDIRMAHEHLREALFEIEGAMRRHGMSKSFESEDIFG